MFRIMSVFIAAGMFMHVANAETFSSTVTNAAAAANNVGAKCANGYNIMKCDCGTLATKNPVTHYRNKCYNGLSMDAYGCYFENTSYDTSVAQYICAPGSGYHACSTNACNCIYGAPVTGWMGASNYTVYRTIQLLQEEYYSCVKLDTDTEHGCAAGYYVSSGSGKSIKCSRCPSPGTSDIGNTGYIASACYIPSGESFSDFTGGGVYIDKCYYEN